MLTDTLAPDALLLPGTWKLSDFAPGEGVSVDAHTEAYNDSAWIDVAVPGDVHRALMATGRLPDPFYDQNEKDCAWIEDREWWYRVEFDGPSAPLESGERWQLVFHGLDTFVTVWLNGESLGQHTNMFRPAVFDISESLRPGQVNTLALCFDRPLDHVDGFGDFRTWWGPNEERVFMRKAQFGYGWDWGPRLPTVGIWRPVELRRQRGAALTGVHAYTLEIDHAQDRALVAVRVEAERFATNAPLKAVIRLSLPGAAEPAAEAVIPVTAAEDSGTAYLVVNQPRLWWTHDLGEPALYNLDISLEQDGSSLDRRRQAVGIRTIALDQSPDPDEAGTRFFRFVLNGVPIFAKGADWIPADSFVGAISEDHYTNLLTMARDAHMNMLRVWGGGLYEHDVFYDLCDRLGILIWQDFMFACAMYPENNPDFTAEVEAEARYQVRRLRSHPCMALWCGNNENQWIHDMACWNTPVARVPGALFYDVILPRAVAELDGRVPYWPGSPYGGNDHNSMADGDRHNWDVWHGGSPRRFGERPEHNLGPDGVTYVRYAEDMGRFISEFGMHAAPVAETLRRCIPADLLFHHSPSMDHHNKDNPKNKSDNLMSYVTGLPTTLEDYIDYSMIAQAEGLKFGIEHYRRRKPHCSGTLFWQLNDCWPVLSWSVIDYYGFGKAGYFYAKRVYAPVLASFKGLPDGGVELWITNDTPQAVEGLAIITAATFDGHDQSQHPQSFCVAANSSAVIWQATAQEVSAGPDRYLSVHSDAGLFPDNRHFFVMIKDLLRTPEQPQATVTPVDDHTLNVTLQASSYAYFVALSVPHEATRYTDNYFDLEPGQQRTITITNALTPLTPDMVTVRAR